MSRETWVFANPKSPSHAVSHASESLVATQMQSPALAACPPSSKAGRRTSLSTRTWLSNVQDLAEYQGELDAASSKRTFMFVFPAAVLEDKLEKRAMTSCYMDLEGCSNNECQTCHAPPAFLVKMSPQQV